jgi:hypothetical protein
MRATPFLLLFSLLAHPARADEPLTLRGSELGAGGSLTRRAADVVGAAGPTTTALLVVVEPRVEGLFYRISGSVEYAAVEGEGYLEMWSEFADGSRYFSRTLDSQGPMSKLAGSSPARPFVLPFTSTPEAGQPTRLELNVVLPGPGRVTLSGLRLESSSAGGDLGWSSPRAGRIGAIAGTAVGLLGAAFGIARSLRARRRPPASTS